MRRRDERLGLVNGQRRMPTVGLGPIPYQRGRGLATSTPSTCWAPPPSLASLSMSCAGTTRGGGGGCGPDLRFVPGIATALVDRAAPTPD